MQHKSEPIARSATDRLSVIVINDFAGVTGGSDKVVLIEAAELARRGHRVTLIAGHGEPARELTDAGVEVHSLGQETTLRDPNRLRAATQGIWNQASAARVRDIVASADPHSTVIHVHGFTKVLSSSVVRAAVGSNIRTIATLHEYFAACPNGGFFNYQTNEVCHLTPLSARCVATNCDARSYTHKLWRVGRSAVQKSFGAMPSGLRAFIAPSHASAQILKPFLPSDRSLHVLPNPVPVRQGPPADLSRNNAFLFVGRLQRDKGPAIFARAARNAGVRAVFVGAGDESETVRTAYPEAELMGWRDSEQVEAALLSARALVSSSLWYETQGLSALEAAARGVPAIVSDVSVLREVVADGETGLWFSGGDVDDLANKLRRLAEDTDLARRLGDGAYRRFWSDQWDTATHVDRLEHIYRSTLRP